MDAVFDQSEDFAAQESFINYCFHRNDEDIQYWERWLNAHPDKKAIAEEAREIVYLLSIRPSLEEKEKEFRKLNIKQPAEPEPLEVASDYYSAPGISPKVWMFTGVAALIAGAVFFWYSRLPQPKITVSHTQPAVNHYATTAGQKRTVLLDDGTRIELNAASNLTIDHDFGSAEGNREVTLSGEAYFNVAKDADKPFVIHTAKMDITVLGTAFNVKDYPNDETGEAALISGSIAVELRNDSEKKIILKPEEKITAFIPDTKLPALPSNKGLHQLPQHFSVATLQPDPLLSNGYASTAWMEGKLVFHDESFEQLAKQLERKYNVQFEFRKATLKTYKFTGVFSTETIEQALHALQLTSPSDPFNYELEGDTVLITEQKNNDKI